MKIIYNNTKTNLKFVISLNLINIEKKTNPNKTQKTIFLNLFFKTYYLNKKMKYI